MSLLLEAKALTIVQRVMYPYPDRKEGLKRVEISRLCAQYLQVKELACQVHYLQGTK